MKAQNGGDEMKSYYNYNYKCVYSTKKVRFSGAGGVPPHSRNSFCSEEQKTEIMVNAAGDK